METETKPALGARLKAAFSMLFTGYGGQAAALSSYPGATLPLIGSVAYPGTRIDYAGEVGQAWYNSAVSICLTWYMDNFPEPSFQVTRQDSEEKKKPVAAHPLADLLNNPNPAYGGDDLWAATVLSYLVDGNAYWVKARADGTGRPMQLWYVPHWMMRPLWPQDGSEFITGYLYGVDTRSTVLRVQDVVHFKFGMDPENMRLGYSRLKALLREIYTDNEATNYMASLLKNMGVAGGMVVPKAGAMFTKEMAQQVKDQLRERTSGDKRGSFVAFSEAVDLLEFGTSPEKMALDKARNYPEDRICGALRLPSMVVGLTSGANAKTYANYQEARKAAYEDGLMPLQRNFARDVDRQLLPDLGAAERDECGWDYSEVRGLGVDRAAMFDRLDKAYAAGWLKRSEAREEAGLPWAPEDEVYFTDLQQERAAAMAQAAPPRLDGPGVRPLKGLFDGGEWWREVETNGHGR